MKRIIKNVKEIRIIMSVEFGILVCIDFIINFRKLINLKNKIIGTI